jgi:predicted extracellular nuclease
MFDHVDDPHTNDNEFLPDGVRRWTSWKSRQKINRIAKVIIASGEFYPVDIIGLAEVENRAVLDQLTEKSPIKNQKYQIIHRESPDFRGIDVALLYKPNTYTPLKNRFISINVPGNADYRSREILYSKGLVHKKDTVHLFVNHWPSRYGGVNKTKPLRCYAAKTVKQITDSLIAQSPDVNIIIMGDFNDYPKDESLMDCLGAGKEGALINLALLSKDSGSYKYQGRWGFLDQFIISEALYNRKNNGLTLASGIKVVSAPFMLQKDSKYTGEMPSRTFLGYKYNGGYSDHLPVMIMLK